ncbi:MAG: helix-turn-helix domain-containing protein [Dethiobacter sp.]|nr:helix-turn-helix domain-containing protein [Dethiobacter sp.]MCL4462863.1 DUF4115 domain-containing protein [Bacillota bacterium]MCL5993623.1 DUF4115 domain-containing protein [Bacillota bacterium]
MREIGQVLRQAREEREMTLEQVSSRTMIAKKYLRALEEGDFNLFPGEVYLKGALRKYAAELGLDQEGLLSRYGGVSELEKAEKNQQEPQKPQSRPAVKRKVQPAQAVRSSRRLNKRRVAVILIIFALLVGGIRAISTIIAPEPPLANEPPPLIDDGAQDILPPEPIEPEPEPEPEPELPQVRVERDSLDPLKLRVINADAIEVLLSFTEHSWVRVHTNGTLLFEGTFTAGESRALTAGESVRVRTGNALGTKLLINGEAIELPQSRNPLTLEINNAGFE